MGSYRSKAYVLFHQQKTKKARNIQRKQSFLPLQLATRNKSEAFSSTRNKSEAFSSTRNKSEAFSSTRNRSAANSSTRNRSAANSSTHNQKSEIIEAKPQAKTKNQVSTRNPQLATRNMSAANSSTRNRSAAPPPNLQPVQRSFLFFNPQQNHSTNYSIFVP